MFCNGNGGTMGQKKYCVQINCDAAAISVQKTDCLCDFPEKKSLPPRHEGHGNFFHGNLYRQLRTYKFRSVRIERILQWCPLKSDSYQLSVQTIKKFFGVIRASVAS